MSSAPVDEMQLGKIAIDGHVIEGRPQGTRTTLVRLLSEIGRSGRAADYAIYCCDVALCRERVGAFSFHYVGLKRGFRLTRLLGLLPVALARKRAAVVLWQYISSPFYFGPSVVMIHDVLPFTHPRLFSLPFRLRCQVLFFLSMLAATRIVTVSDFSRSELSRLFPYFSPKLETAHNGPSFPAEVYFSASVQPRPARPYILAVGRIEARKNIPLLISAFLSANLPDVDLLIIGKADLGFVVQIPSDARIVMRSDVSDVELIDLYKGASLFVFPSLAEGFGLPLLDAILFGLPCISSNQTAMPEIAAGMARFFDPVAPGAEACLAQRIRGHFRGATIHAPTELQRRAQLERFNWAHSASKLMRIMDEVAASGSRRNKAIL